MTLAYPIPDLLSLIPAAEPRLTLVSRGEISRTAGGVTVAKDLGPALWRLDVASRPFRWSADLGVEAILDALDNGARTFLEGDRRRRQPASDPAATLNLAGAQLDVDAANLGHCRITGLPNGFVVTRGDYFGFRYGAAQSYALHRFAEGGAVSGGATPWLSIRPYLRPGAVDGLAVTMRAPVAEFMLEPGSVAVSQPLIGFTAVAFSAVQVFR